MIQLLLTPAMAVINRFRGGGFYADRLPGHPRFYAAPFVGLLAWAFMPWPSALAFAVAFLLWSLLPWGHLMCLGHYTPDRPISTPEAGALKVAGGNYYGGLGLLHLAGLIPAAVLVHPVAPLMSIPIVAAYALAWRVTPETPIRTAEILVGGLWGLLTVLRPLSLVALLLLGGCGFNIDVNGYRARPVHGGPIGCAGVCKQEMTRG
jgi:hypothetical protein